MVSNVNEGRCTRNTQRIDYQELTGYMCYTSLIEPKNMKDALDDEYWTIIMLEELNQFA